MVIAMKFCECSPYVRYARCLTKYDTITSMLAYDMRLFACSKGSCVITVGGEKYCMLSGDVLFWRSEIEYGYTECSPELELYGCNFDFSQKNSDVSFPIGPEKADVFYSKPILDNTHFEDLTDFDGCIYAKNCSDILELLMQISTEYSSHRIFCEQVCSGLMKQALSLLIRHKASPAVKNKTSAEKIIQYIQSNCARDVSNTSLAKHFGYHPVHINRIVHGYTGMSLHKYVLFCRITNAIKMLSETDSTLTLIASETGFADSSHFANAFKKFTGKRPGEFRRG